jgi:hypothetical protein
VNEDVEKWKDSARTAKNAIVDIFGSTRDEVGARAVEQRRPSRHRGCPLQHMFWHRGEPEFVSALGSRVVYLCADLVVLEGGRESVGEQDLRGI